MERHRVVVYPPPSEGGGRRVCLDCQDLGIAYDLRDLMEFLRRAGLDPDSIYLDDELFDWHSAGPTIW
ncbi:hypothetical protein OG937_01885 [Streptomyces sp. NBC_00510]